MQIYEFKILAQTWKVFLVPAEDMWVIGNFGRADYNRNEIYLNASNTAERQGEALRHELAHAFIKTGSIFLPENDDIPFISVEQVCLFVGKFNTLIEELAVSIETSLSTEKVTEIETLKLGDKVKGINPILTCYGLMGTIVEISYEVHPNMPYCLVRFPGFRGHNGSEYTKLTDLSNDHWWCAVKDLERLQSAEPVSQDISSNFVPINNIKKKNNEGDRLIDSIYIK